MTYQSGPTIIQQNQIVTYNWPGSATQTTAPVAVQITNASGFILSTNGPNTPQIQPFTATTIPVYQGQQLLISPGFNAYPNIGGYCSAEWLIADETPVTPDGPLTAAATVASLTGANALMATANIGSPTLLPLLSSGHYSISAMALTGYYNPASTTNDQLVSIGIPDPLVPATIRPWLPIRIAPVPTNGASFAIALPFNPPILTIGPVVLNALFIATTTTHAEAALAYAVSSV